MSKLGALSTSTIARLKSTSLNKPRSLGIHPSAPREGSQELYDDKEVLQYFSGGSKFGFIAAKATAAQPLHFVSQESNIADIHCYPLEYVLYFSPSLETVQTIHQLFPKAIRSVDPTNGWNVLHRAIFYRCSEEVILYLIPKCPQRFAISPSITTFNTPIHLACRESTSPRVLEALIQRAFTVDKATKKMPVQPVVSLSQRTSSGFTALHIAIMADSSREERIERIKLLLEGDPSLSLTATAEGSLPNMLARSVKKENRDKPIYKALDKIVKIAQKSQDTYSTRHELETAITQCQQYSFTEDTTMGMTATTANVTLTSTASSENSLISTHAAFETTRAAVASFAKARLASLREQVQSLEDIDMLIGNYTRDLDDAIAMKQWDKAKRTHALIEKLEAQKAAEFAVSGKSAIDEASQHVLDALQHNGPWKVAKLSPQFLVQSTNSFDSTRHLGTGGFGTVYLGVDPKRGTTFAVKKINDNVVKSPKVYERVKPKLYAEIQKLSQLHHPNIVRLLGYYLSDNPDEDQCLVYELAGGGSLSGILKKKGGREILDWRKRIKTAKCLASALLYLHSKGIFHRDIKPGNICFSDDLEKVILIDYGIAVITDEDTGMNVKTSIEVTSIIGTDSYMAPEYKSTGIYGVKCDIFSFGVVLRTLLSGSTRLLRGMDHTLVCPLDDLAGDWDLSTANELQQLLRRCCEDDPSVRPDAKNLLDQLEEMENQCQPGLNEEEELMVEEELTKSRSITGAGANITEIGDCRCGRKNVHGLKCLREESPHFSCKSCFSEHLLENIGEDQIVCREVGCISHPYTLDQVRDHSSPALFAEHLRINRNNTRLIAESDRRLQQIIAESVRIGVNQALSTSLDLQVAKILKSLELIGKNELDCPHLCFIVPTKANRGKTGFMSLLHSLRNLGQTSFLFYFVCAYDKTPVPEPIMLHKNKAWMRVAGPLVQLSILVASTAIQLQGVPLQIPVPGIGCKEQLRKMDALMSQFVSPEESLAIERHVAASMRGDVSPVFSVEAVKLKDAAYGAIKKVALENPEWKQYLEFVQCKKTGEFAWVHKKNVESWKNAS